MHIIHTEQKHNYRGESINYNVIIASESAHLNNYIKVLHKLLFSVNQFTDVLLSFQLRI